MFFILKQQMEILKIVEETYLSGTFIFLQEVQQFLEHTQRQFTVT